MTAKEVSSELIRAKDVSTFDRWNLPSFEASASVPAYLPEAPAASSPAATEEQGGQSEEVELESVKPLTLDELEAIRQDAYNEGFAVGEKDGFHAGQLKAKQEADVALHAKLEGLELLMGHLLAPIAEQDQQIEQMLVRLVDHVCQQVIRRELSVDSSQLTQVLSEALKLLPMGAGNVRIHINPQDFELVKALRERHEENWRILEDATLLAGGCRVETEHSQIDASVETRMTLALKQLFEQQREQVSTPVAADLSVDLNAVSSVSSEPSELSEPSDAP
jgi:flagellar assembly protein FliH